MDKLLSTDPSIRANAMKELVSMRSVHVAASLIRYDALTVQQKIERGEDQLAPMMTIRKVLQGMGTDGLDGMVEVLHSTRSTPREQYFARLELYMAIHRFNIDGTIPPLVHIIATPSYDAPFKEAAVSALSERALDARTLKTLESIARDQEGDSRKQALRILERQQPQVENSLLRR